LSPIGRVVRGHDQFVADAEIDVHPLTVGGRRARGVAVLAIDLLQRSMNDGSLPEDLARGAVETQQHAVEFLRKGGETRSPQTIGDACPVPGWRGGSPSVDLAVATEQDEQDLKRVSARRRSQV